MQSAKTTDNKSPLDMNFLADNTKQTWHGTHTLIHNFFPYKISSDKQVLPIMNFPGLYMYCEDTHN